MFIATQLVKVRRGRMIICRFQGFVDTRIVVEGLIKGIPLPTEALETVIQQRQSGRQ